MNFTKLALMSLVLVFTTGCASAKKKTQTNADETEVIQYCNYMTDEDNFYGNGIGQSTSMQSAKDKAMLAARQQITEDVEATVETFTKRYRKDVNDDMQEKTENRLQVLARQTLSNTGVACDKLMRTTDGKYRSYISLRLSKTAIKQALQTALLEDESLKLDFDQAQFDKVADEAFAEAGEQ